MTIATRQLDAVRAIPQRLPPSEVPQFLPKNLRQAPLPALAARKAVGGLDAVAMRDMTASVRGRRTIGARTIRAEAQMPARLRTRLPEGSPPASWAWERPARAFASTRGSSSPEPWPRSRFWAAAPARIAAASEVATIRVRRWEISDTGSRLTAGSIASRIRRGGGASAAGGVSRVLSERPAVGAASILCDAAPKTLTTAPLRARLTSTVKVLCGRRTRRSPCIGEIRINLLC